jgi:hypothetical protein
MRVCELCGKGRGIFNLNGSAACEDCRQILVEQKHWKWCALHQIKYDADLGCSICNGEPGWPSHEEREIELAPPPESPDMVNSPPHYASGEIECIDAMVQVFGIDAVKTYARINHFKYLWRHRYKNSEEQDLSKADWYWSFSQGDDPRAKT